MNVASNNPHEKSCFIKIFNFDPSWRPDPVAIVRIISHKSKHPGMIRRCGEPPSLPVKSNVYSFRYVKAQAVETVDVAQNKGIVRFAGYVVS
jgi:hypothetical protein